MRDAEEQSLRAGVCEAPDDDGRRLVYADWLDDHGSSDADRARAEFIRVQVERARLDPYDPRQLDLRGREAFLRLCDNRHLSTNEPLTIGSVKERRVFFDDLEQHVREGVERLFALRFRRLHHQRFRHNQRKVNRRRMVAVI